MEGLKGAVKGRLGAGLHWPVASTAGHYWSGLTT